MGQGHLYHRGRVLVNYAVPNTSWNLSARIEDIASSGSPTDGSANLLYGAGSKAWSFTFTPTYQGGVLFVRGEVSFVGASATTSGLGLRHERDEHLADPLRDRDRHPVLSPAGPGGPRP